MKVLQLFTRKCRRCVSWHSYTYVYLFLVKTNIQGLFLLTFPQMGAVHFTTFFPSSGIVGTKVGQQSPKTIDQSLLLTVAATHLSRTPAEQLRILLIATTNRQFNKTK